MHRDRPVLSRLALIMPLTAWILISCNTSRCSRPSAEAAGAASARSLGPGPVYDPKASIDPSSLHERDGLLQLPVPVDGEAAQRLTNEARDLLHAGREDAALRRLLAATRDGLDAGSLTLLAGLLGREGHQELALAAYRTALARQPAAERQRRLAWALSRFGRHLEAVTAWSSALEADPADASTRGRLAAAQHLAGLPVDAELVPDAPPALRHLLETGRPARAAIRALGRDAPSRGQALGPEIRIDSGGSAEAAEVSMVAWGDQLTVAWNDLREGGAEGIWRIGVATSLDGGLTWSDQLLRPLDPQALVHDGDPMTAVDRRTGDRWVGGIEFGGGGSVYLAHQKPDGTFDPVVEAQQGVFDKCWMGAGPAPGDPLATRLYVAYNFPNQVQRSSDLGQTWTAGTPLDLNGIGFQPRVAGDGTLYLGYSEFVGFELGPGVMLQTSTDAAATVSAPIRAADRVDAWDAQDGSRFPGLFRVPPLPNLAISPLDGTLYFVYFDTTAAGAGDADVDLYLVRSTDGGATWTSPLLIAGGPEVGGDQFMPWLEVDEAGDLHLAFFDSRHTVQPDDVVDGRLDVYYSASRDGGASWTEVRVTDTSFGTGGVDWPGLGQFLGDYLGLAVTNDGVVIGYPRTTTDDLDIYVRRITLGDLFADGFESGDTAAWSAAVP